MRGRHLERGRQVVRRALLALAVGGGVGLSSVVPSTVASASATGLTAAFSTSSAWSGGYVGAFTITNPTTTTQTGWSISFTLPAGSQVTSSWNGTMSQSGSVVTIANASWNATLAPGGSASVGLSVAYTGSLQALSGCTINGTAACTIPGSTSGSGTSGGTSGGGSSTGGSGSGGTSGGSTSGGSTSGTTTATGLRAAMALSSSWNGGYTATFTITNSGTTTVPTWSLGFTLPSGGTLGSLWNGTSTVSGASVSVTPAGWNASLAPGAKATVGFEVDGTNQFPVACAVASTSSSCTIPTSPAPTPTPTPAPSTCTVLPGIAGPIPFAPYADVSLYPQVNLANTACATGIRTFTLAFFTGSSCTPTMAGVSFKNPTLLADITRLRSLGGDVIGSFGGASGLELAQTCSTAAQAQAAYQSVIDYYGLTQVDFDIEGSAVADSTANTIRSTALAAIQRSAAAAGRTLSVSLTLPVLPQGLPTAELSVIRSAKSAGLAISVVNVMAMDYGDGAAPNPSGQMGKYAIDSAKATEAQLATIYTTATSAQLWAMVGVTPMIGQNDTSTEVFTTTDASTLAAWAKTQGIGRLSMWSIARDVQCPSPTSWASATCSGQTQAPWAFSSILRGG